LLNGFLGLDRQVEDKCTVNDHAGFVAAPREVFKKLIDIKYDSA